MKKVAVDVSLFRNMVRPIGRPCLKTRLILYEIVHVIENLAH